MAAAAVAEFQRAQSLLVTDRNASIDILHAIGRCNFHSGLLKISRRVENVRRGLSIKSEAVSLLKAR